MAAPKARGTNIKGRSVGAKLHHLLQAFSVPSEQFVREMVDKFGFRPDAVRGWLDDSRNPYESTLERISDYWKIYIPDIGPNWFLTEARAFEEMVAARLAMPSRNMSVANPRYSATLKLTANDVRSGLKRLAVKEEITRHLGEFVQRGNTINFAAIYERNGDPLVQDPYDPKWSIQTPDDHARFYRDVGLLARPVMESYPQLQLGAPGRRGIVSEEVGQPEFMLLQNDARTGTGGRATRHVAIAPLDSSHEFFLVAVAWGQRELFSYNLFSTEFLDCRDSLVRLLS